ncbi:putative DUF2384 domain-containing protein [Gammaproteobacteria bacterium]
MTTELKLAELTRDVLQILSAWGTNSAQQRMLLGLPIGSPDYYRLDIPLPEDKEVLLRVETLLAIDQSVCLVFPHAPELARLWITTPSHLFGRRTPLEVMLAEGLSGIMDVRSLLDGTEVW